MRVVFMGTPEFAVPSLLALVEEGYEIAAVVTQPDKAKGRGKNVSFSPVKEAALAHGLQVYQPVKARDPAFVESLRQLSPEVIVVAAFGQILPEAILQIPPLGCINVHSSLLPKYRGAAPMQWAIINGETVSGVTTMYMEKGLDTGDIIYMEEITLDPQETGGSLSEKLSHIGADLLIRTLRDVASGTAPRIPQDDARAGAYAKMLDKQMGELDFEKPAAQLERLIRGLDPWPCAYTQYHGKTLKIWKAAVRGEDVDGKDPQEVFEVSGNLLPGQVTKTGKTSFCVQTGNGQLEILEVQLQGKKRMDAGAFLRGNPLKAGEWLGRAE